MKLKINEKYMAPDFVKGASDNELYGYKLPVVMYADSEKSFPVHTPAATWLSAAFCLEGRGEKTATAVKIKSAMGKFGMHGLWDAMEKFAVENRSPLPDKIYALPEQKKYPINDENQIKKACEYLFKYSDDFELEDRQTFAKNLLNALDSKNIKLANDFRHKVEIAAGLGSSAESAVDVVNDYVNRLRRIGYSDVAEHVVKAAQAVDSGSLDTSSFADTVKSIGYKLHDAKVADFVDRLNVMTPVKKAELEQKIAISPTGRVYLKDELDKIDDNLLIKAFGTNPIMTSEKRASLLEKYGEVMEDILLANGIKPFHDPNVNEEQVASTNWAKYL